MYPRAAVSVLVGLSSALVLASCAIAPAGPGEVDANLSYVLLGLYSEEYPINHVMLREVDTGEGIKARRDKATNLILTSLPPGRYRLSRLSFGRPPEEVRLEGATISFEPGYVYYLADIIMPAMTPAEVQNGWMTWARAFTVVRVSGLGTPLHINFSFERRVTTIEVASDAYPELFAVCPIVIPGEPGSALPR